jgi:SAM-dependent methyltransferase
LPGSLDSAADEYDDGERYDQEYGAWEPDGPFYERLAKASGGPVLELGCGTGRIAIALARQGFEITGVDVAASMLAQARSKGVGLPVSWHQADCRTLDLGRRYRFAFMAANGFQHLVTAEDQAAAARSVRAHLLTGAAFAFTARNPVANEDVRDVTEEYPWGVYRDGQGRAVQVSGYHRWNAETRTLVYTTIRRQGNWTDRRDLTLRFAPILVLVAMLGEIGFASVTVHAGFDGEPFDEASSPDAVLVARA